MIVRQLAVQDTIKWTECVNTDIHLYNATTRILQKLSWPPNLQVFFYMQWLVALLSYLCQGTHAWLHKFIAQHDLIKIWRKSSCGRFVIWHSAKILTQRCRPTRCTLHAPPGQDLFWSHMADVCMHTACSIGMAASLYWKWPAVTYCQYRSIISLCLSTLCILGM